VFGGNVRFGDEGHFLLGKVFETNHSAVAPLEAVIFFDRQEHQPVAPIGVMVNGSSRALSDRAPNCF
jgi:hypothetical protein